MLNFNTYRSFLRACGRAAGGGHACRQTDRQTDSQHASQPDSQSARGRQAASQRHAGGGRMQN